MPAKKAKTPKAAKVTKTKTPRAPFTWREAALISFIVLATSCIGITLAADAAFDPARDAEQALLNLADDYYVEFLYPSTLNYDFRDPETALSEFQHAGFATIHLYQLLLYKNNATQVVQPFDNDYYRCNQNDSTIRIFPVAPWGPRDYRVEYNLKCTKLPH